MATVLDFPVDTIMSAKIKAGVCHSDNTKGEVVIFPGIRRERTGEQNSVSQPKTPMTRSSNPKRRP